MQFGKAVGTACSTFAITNIDDMFVLVTFFAEAASNPATTPLKITIGQYLGFSIIMLVSMIGFGVALVLPAEPIGFLGLLPILLGVWKGLHLVFPDNQDEQDTDGQERSAEEGGEPERAGRFARFRGGGMKSVFSVAIITIMNGGDNIGTYIPLFSQAKGAEIAIYVITYYILLGVWILIAWLIMKQKLILHVAKKWAAVVVPFLYIGLGIYIVVKSECYPWSIENIDKTVVANPGTVSMAVSTTAILLACIMAMIWLHWKKRAVRREDSIHELENRVVEEGTDGVKGAKEDDTITGPVDGPSPSQGVTLDEEQEGGRPKAAGQEPRI